MGAGTVTREDELILKSGTSYLFCINNADTGNDNIIDYRATWYEHTDKIAKFWCFYITLYKLILGFYKVILFY